MQNAIPPTPEDDDDTVLVGRGDDETVIVSREETVIVPREETVIVPREETVIVIRGAAVPDDEDTISISTDRGSQSSARSPAPTSDAAPERSDAAPVSPEAQVDDDDTVIVGEEPVVPAVGISAADDEVTVRVERSDSQLPTVRVTRTGSSQVRPAMVPQRGRRRGELRPAPVPSGFGGVPLVASGAGAVSSYRARTLVPPSAALSATSTTAPADRVLTGSASVRARSRRTAAWTLTAAAASALVIAGGVLWAVKDLVGF